LYNPVKVSLTVPKKRKGKAVEESRQAKLARKRRERHAVSQLEVTLTRMIDWAKENPEWAGTLLDIVTHEIFLSATWGKQAKKDTNGHIQRDSEVESDSDELAESDCDDDDEEESESDGSEDSEDSEDLEFGIDENVEDLEFVVSEKEDEDEEHSDDEVRGRASNQVPRCHCCRAEDKEETLSLEGLTMD
jgi:hypothetical protein